MNNHQTASLKFDTKSAHVLPLYKVGAESVDLDGLVWLILASRDAAADFAIDRAETEDVFSGVESRHRYL
jgi:hypothetical protein